MFCLKCGQEIADKSAFCPLCGAKQVYRYKEVFVRNGISEQDFIANINKWFQLHPKVANVSCKFGTDTALGLLANKYELNQFVVEYELFEQNNSNQYGLVKEESIALMKHDVREAVGQWQQTHPNTKIVNWTGGVHSRGHVGSHLLGGIGARNRTSLYILFKFPRPMNNA